MWILISLLLALPVYSDPFEGMEDDEELAIRRKVDEAVELMYEWVTVEVDSLNLGRSANECREPIGHSPPPNPDGLINAVLMYTYPGHDWVEEKPFRDMEARWVHWTDKNWVEPLLIRERICRSCLRHEWQKRCEIKPPPSEFELLKSQLKED